MKRQDQEVRPFTTRRSRSTRILSDDDDELNSDEIDDYYNISSDSDADFSSSSYDKEDDIDWGSKSSSTRASTTARSSSSFTYELRTRSSQTISSAYSDEKRGNDEDSTLEFANSVLNDVHMAITLFIKYFSIYDSKIIHSLIIIFILINDKGSLRGSMIFGTNFRWELKIR